MLPMPEIIPGTNSYASSLEAYEILKNRMGNAVWFDAPAGDNERALMTASSQISIVVKDEYRLPLSPVPDGLKAACCELALSLLSNPDSVDQVNTNNNVKRVKAGSAEVEFFGAVRGDRFTRSVMDILKLYGYIDAGSGSTNAGSMSFGTDSESGPLDVDYNLTGGYL